MTAASLIAKAMPFLKQALPASVAFRGITKADPKLKRFIYGAATAGYGADAVLDFLREIGESPGKKKFRRDTQQRAAEGKARPDELARLPSETPARLARAGAQIAGGAAAAGMQGLFGGGQQPQQAQIAGPGGPGGPGGAQPQQPQIGGPQPGAPQAPQQPGAPQAQPQQQPVSFVERALEGAEYFDLDQGLRNKIAPVVNQLFKLEQQGLPWEHKTVQKIAKGLRRLVGKEGMVGQEAERFGGGGQQQAPQGAQQGAPQGGGGEDPNAVVLKALEAFSQLMRGG